jgi:catechol 2,3-dioxygenase-like lactoylglutathione lyase family enzyme
MGKTYRTGICVLGLLAVLVARSGTGQTADRGIPGPQSASPVLRNTCLITKNVSRLAEFYSQILQMQPKMSGADYAEFPTSGGVVAIFSAQTQESYIPGSARPGENKSAILEFEVNDVDQQYARLQSFVKTWVKPATTQPWGTRSIYFRDPDGNLIDFYAWVKRH